VRRVVSLLLVPMVLLTQWAGTSHCHGSHQPPDHDRVPHFHFGGFPLRQSNHHHHDGHGHHHHHDGEDRDDGDRDEPSDEPAPRPDHDDDAIYVPVEPGTAAVPLKHVRDTSASAHAAVSLTTLAPASTPTASLFPRAHPPPGLSSGSCPVYLQKLTLLI
jgi:hypothetical protein